MMDDGGRTTGHLEDEAIAARMRATGVVAVVRAPSAERAAGLAETLAAAGLDLIEISFNTPDAAEAIRALSARRPDVLVGAGTVLRAEEAERAAAAGAHYLLSPVYDAEIDRKARALGCLYVPGVFSAGEAWTALRAGRRLLKLFPASVLGVGGMRALVEPFGGVDTLPTGGIGVADVAAWRGAGAVAVGLGGALSRAADPAGAARAALAAARLPQGNV